MSLLFCKSLQQGHVCHEKTLNLLSQGLQSYRAGGLGDLPPGALQLKSELLRERDMALKWVDNMIEPQRNGRFSGNRLWDQYQLQLPHEDREGWQLRVNSISKSALAC